MEHEGHTVDIGEQMDAQMDVQAEGSTDSAADADGGQDASKTAEASDKESCGAQDGTADTPDSPDADEAEGPVEDPQEDTEEGPSGEKGANGEKGAAAEPGKKGFFKKNKKKDKKDERIEELTDQVKRQMAEFDNFRKRTEKEKTQMYEIGAKSIIEKVLPVVDNFERGLAAVPEENKEDAFVDGMNKIYKQMMTMLEEAGVEPIEAVGKEFDPNLHNAVMQTESEEFESGVIAQELQKGYKYRDSVVRHSMVAVVN